MTAAHTDAGSRILVSGAVAGTVTSFGFTVLHHVLISNIWFSALPMMAAGAICGLCLAWSYRLVFARHSTGGWLLYNLMFVGLFIVLGGVSFMVFEPIYTIAGLVTGEQSPDALLGQAIPMSALFGVVAGVVMAGLRRADRRQGVSLVITCVVLTVLLGHNAAVLGLVHMSQEAVPLLAQFYGLIAAIMVGNATAFVALERRRFFARSAVTAPGPAVHGTEVGVTGPLP
ncbi:MAG TPA: hypothetical protein VK929_09475 [Longimicrobiales bacterium]|nr:hypothetical protein [Longimicrobiales bacterium]